MRKLWTIGSVGLLGLMLMGCNKATPPANVSDASQAVNQDVIKGGEALKKEAADLEEDSAAAQIPGGKGQRVQPNPGGGGQ